MSLGHGASVVRNGLVFHLDAANTKSYPGSGTVWNDLSGNGNNGTLINGPSYVSDSNGSISFNGTNNYVNLPLLPITNSIIGKSEASASFWFKRNGGLGAARNLLAIGVIASQPTLQRFAFILTATNILRINVRSVSTDAAQNKETVDTFTTNNWTFCCATVDLQNNDTKIYINGSQVSATGTLTFSQSTFSNEVGASNVLGSNNGSTQFFIGNISNAMFYNRGLTAAEVLQNFNALRGRYGI